MKRGRVSVLFVASVIAIVVAAGCGSSTGATTAPASTFSTTTAPPAAAATPTAEASATAAPTVSEVPTVTPPFTVSSSAFAEGGAIPRANTCDGADRSIPLAWSAAPTGTAAFALVMNDPDAGGFIHWVAYNIPASTESLAEGTSTAAGAPPQGKNGFGRVGYGGPCPPSGTHHYVVRLIALDSMLSPTGTPSASAVLGGATGHTLAEATLTGTYKRGG